MDKEKFFAFYISAVNEVLKYCKISLGGFLKETLQM